MPAPTEPGSAFLARCDPYQAAFHARWHALAGPHARALAFLLTAPDLLDPDYPSWQGRLARGDALLRPDGIDGWLAAVDADDGWIIDAGRPHTRLGLYAERLMAAYFAWRGVLAAHSLQVRAGRNETVGEFDFLLRGGAGLLHVELATKFYLLAPGDVPARFQGLVGPNLGDRFSAKMDKILSRQLALGTHPAARALLPEPLAGAVALVKGWLFYQGDYLHAPLLPGVDAAHPRGFWCAEEALPAEASAIELPKLQWLAPARAARDDARVLGPDALRAHLRTRFEGNPGPALLALVEREGDSWLETRRGFVVPPGWAPRARRYGAHGPAVAC